MLSFLAAAFVSACSTYNAASPTPTSRPPQLPPTAGTCDANQAQFAVRQQASADLLERSRIAAGASVARFVRPDQPITMEFLGSRLTLALDNKDVVVRVTCG